MQFVPGIVIFSGVASQSSITVSQLIYNTGQRFEVMVGLVGLILSLYLWKMLKT